MGKMSSYDKLRYVRSESGGKRNWLGNLRWYVAEEKEGFFSFECISNLHCSTHEEDLANRMRKQLFQLDIGESAFKEWIYGADYIRTLNMSIFLPFYEYGGLVLVKRDFAIQFEGECYQKEDCLIVKTGAYYIAFALKDNYQMQEQRISVHVEDGMWFSVAFHIDEKKAIQNCKRLIEGREEILETNRKFWNDYLASCPTVKLEKDYEYKHDSLGIREYHTCKDFDIRQLWHWWCVLVNVSEVEFNRCQLYMAPDKTNWRGTWGNDGPQCMAALSLTNQKELARHLMITYLTDALKETGEFSWYMHADGTGCYGVKGDVGRYSHSDPYMPHTVAYYIRNTGDDSILEADAGGMSVYEKLKNYVLSLHNQRDINGDALIEWANLWETGWDDKGGTFFENASLEEWVDIVATGTDEEISDFYKANQRPVVAIVEQVITLWALKGMEELAHIKNDEELVTYCSDTMKLMQKSVSVLCWNEEDGFYYDIDVKTGQQTREKSADAFYWMNFEKDAERAGKLYAHLENEEEFNCYYIPMLSKDSKGFNPMGYWSGGHWPREMSVIAMGLHRCNYQDKAMELLIRAIMSQEGNMIAEVINPLTGKRSTGITKMACAIMNVLALLDVNDKVKWN